MGDALASPVAVSVASSFSAEHSEFTFCLENYFSLKHSKTPSIKD